MSGETEKSVSGWTVDTLKEHLEAIIAAHDKRYQQRFDAQESANKYAQEKANEFRGSLEDIGKKQMPRSEAEALIRAAQERAELAAKTNNDKLDQIQARMDRNEGRGTAMLPAFEQLIKDTAATRAVQSESLGNKSGRLSQQQLFMVIIPSFIGFLILAIGTIVAIAYAVRK